MELEVCNRPSYERGWLLGCKPQGMITFQVELGLPDELFLPLKGLNKVPVMYRPNAARSKVKHYTCACATSAIRYLVYRAQDGCAL